MTSRAQTSARPHAAPPEPDRETLRLAAEGDERAFSKLVRQYEQLVYSFSFSVCRDREKAEEAWQDTFVNVYRKLHQFDRRSKFSTWLYRIVVNNCLMKNRRRKLEDIMVRYDDPPAAGMGHDGDDVAGRIVSWKETPQSIVEDAELRGALDDAILRLPVEYRVVFVLRDIEGLSIKETSEALNLSETNVKTRLLRARLNLREQLSTYYGEHFPKELKK